MRRLTIVLFSVVVVAGQQQTISVSNGARFINDGSAAPGSLLCSETGNQTPLRQSLSALLLSGIVNEPSGFSGCPQAQRMG
jgi:hypothetical protein